MARALWRRLSQTARYCRMWGAAATSEVASGVQLTLSGEQSREPFTD